MDKKEEISRIKRRISFYEKELESFEKLPENSVKDLICKNEMIELASWFLLEQKMLLEKVMGGA